MGRFKQISMYFIWIIAFFIFSNFLIYVGLNASYSNIERRDSTKQVQTYQAEATKINGRIRGIISNENDNNSYLTGKYVKFSLYSTRDILLAEKYIEIDLTNKEQQVLELLFRVDNVSYYKAEIVDEKIVSDLGEFTLFSEDPTTSRVIFSVITTFLFFM